MMGSGGTHPLVEQHQSAHVVHSLREFDVVLHVEAGDLGMGPPYQAPDRDASLGKLLEHSGELHAIDEVLVGVAAPIGEVQSVPHLKRAEARWSRSK